MCKEQRPTVPTRCLSPVFPLFCPPKGLLQCTGTRTAQGQPVSLTLAASSSSHLSSSLVFISRLIKDIEQKSATRVKSVSVLPVAQFLLSRDAGAAVIQGLQWDPSRPSRPPQPQEWRTQSLPATPPDLVAFLEYSYVVGKRGEYHEAQVSQNPSIEQKECVHF